MVVNDVNKNSTWNQNNFTADKFINAAAVQNGDSNLAGPYVLFRMNITGTKAVVMPT